MAAPGTGPAQPAQTCDTCGAPADRGQLVCLECGSRIGLSYRRPPSWKVPLAILAATAAVIGGGGYLVYQGLEGEAADEVEATPVRITGDGKQKKQTAAQKRRAAARKKAAAERRAAERERSRTATAPAATTPSTTTPSTTTPSTTTP